MIKAIDNPTHPHLVFAWLPVLVFDRAANKAKTVWLRQVSRQMVSVQGNVMWQYSMPEAAK